MREYKVKDWNDFNNIVFDKSWDNEIQRYRSNYVYRGLSHLNYDLLPSLNRVCGNRIYLEKPLIRNFAKYASLELKDKNNFWEIVSLGQHHGLPTRLLDWTFSPYIAAHFATENIAYNDCECAIWCINFISVKKYLPKCIQDMLNAEMANGFSIDFLSKNIFDFEKLKEIEEEGAFPIFFEPSSIDDRIIYPGMDGLCKWLTRHYTPKEKIFVKEKIVKRLEIIHNIISYICKQMNIEIRFEKLVKNIEKQDLKAILIWNALNEQKIKGILLDINYSEIPYQSIEENKEDLYKTVDDKIILLKEMSSLQSFVANVIHYYQANTLNRSFRKYERIIR